MGFRDKGFIGGFWGSGMDEVQGCRVLKGLPFPPRKMGFGVQASAVFCPWVQRMSASDARNDQGRFAVRTLYPNLTPQTHTA